ncbi:Protein CBG22584 [Caenorhabditis briggsae]|uniref:Protein CBG22584 n=1 Tax=Caenorhabditis briggsae TaxID=6238 RepID=A8Y2L8_CAEBR|nr:Protein CBG22584 [Caenorhabditis briggsae]CAP39142.1 Protein CBG22584 [Caenorhabditis briggsae]
MKFSEDKSRNFGLFWREPGYSQFSGTSTGHYKKEAAEKEEGTVSASISLFACRKIGKMKFSEDKSRNFGLFWREPGYSQFSGTSTGHYKKEAAEKEEGRKTGMTEVSNSWISRKFQIDNLCQSFFATTSTSSSASHGCCHPELRK